MKKLVLACSILMTAPAFAGVSWVQTPFWQTAYPTDYVARLENTNTELAAECRDFENTVFKKGGDQYADIFSTFDQLSLPSDMQHRSFYVEMTLALPTSLELENLLITKRGAELKTLTIQKATSDLIPQYTQYPAQVLLQQESLKAQATIGKQPDSLTAVAEKLGVPVGATIFINRGGSYNAVFSSKAAACDVLNGRASLQLNARVAIKIAFDSQRVIESFYTDVEKIATAAMAKTKSAPARAALLGFRLGEFLSKRSPSDVAEMQMLGLITQFFDIESMTPNKNWTDGVGGKVLSVTGTAYDQSATLKIVGPSVVIK